MYKRNMRCNGRYIMDEEEDSDLGCMKTIIREGSWAQGRGGDDEDGDDDVHT